MNRYGRRAVLTSAGATLAGLAMPNIARAAARRLRLGHNNTSTSVVHAGATAFAAALTSLSDGAVSVDVFPNAQLGTEAQMIVALVEGTLDAMVTNIGQATAYAKDATLLEMPYLFRDVATARAAFDGPMVDDLAERLKAQSILIAGWGELGVRHITANKPIRTPADLKGLKIRVQVSEPTMQTFSALGAAAETMPFAQLTDALRTGRFEAQENPIAIIQGATLNLVQSHISLTGHVYSPGPILLSNDVVAELPVAQQQAVLKAGAAATRTMREFCDRADKTGIGELSKAGMTIVGDVDRAAFQQAAGDATDRLAKIFGAESIQRIRKYSA